jgi:hypothetical protein
MINYTATQVDHEDTDPVFSRLREITNTPYPVFFRTYKEMSSWLKARKWRDVDPKLWDSHDFPEWLKKDSSDGEDLLLKVSLGIFEDGKLQIYTSDEWNDSWVEKSVYDEFGDTPSDDEVPF